MERKSNDQPFHTLIPVQVLEDVLTSAAVFPLIPKGGHPLDHAHYHNSKVVVDSAFRTALKRSGLTITGHLSPHDLRDVFRTEATIKGADYDAREFAFGHQIDPRGYDKCYNDFNWLWKELSKIYKQQTPQLGTLTQENEQLRGDLSKIRKDIEDLNDRFETAFKKKITNTEND